MSPTLLFVRPGKEYKYSRLPPWLGPFCSHSKPISQLQETSGARIWTPTTTPAQASSSGRSWSSGKGFSGLKYAIHELWFQSGCRLQGVLLARHLTLYGVGKGGPSIPSTGQAFFASYATRNTSVCCLSNSDLTYHHFLGRVITCENLKRHSKSSYPNSSLTNSSLT